MAAKKRTEGQYEKAYKDLKFYTVTAPCGVVTYGEVNRNTSGGHRALCLSSPPAYSSASSLCGWRG